MVVKMPCSVTKMQKAVVGGVSGASGRTMERFRPLKL